MVGYVTDAVAKALRAWQPLKDMNIIPVFATGGTALVENTPIPCVAIHVFGDEGRGNTYIGGGIRQFFDLSLFTIIPIHNYTFSPDGGKQAEMLDISDEVIRCIELTNLLDDVKQAHDLNLQFDRMETEQTYAHKGAESITVDVHKVVYRGDVQFNMKDESYNRYVELLKVIADNGINKTIIQ